MDSAQVNYIYARILNNHMLSFHLRKDLGKLQEKVEELQEEVKQLHLRGVTVTREFTPTQWCCYCGDAHQDVYRKSCDECFMVFMVSSLTSDRFEVITSTVASKGYKGAEFRDVLLKMLSALTKTNLTKSN